MDQSLEGQSAKADTIARIQTPDSLRWRRCRVDDNPLAAAIVVRVWGRAPELLWQLLATALIAQRLEDGLPTPRTRADPLADELRILIDQAVADRNTSTA
ncbi:hypothetical protein ACIGO9_31450 [Nocardia asteroides]|uniref:hypothetical protein n=1 Tax=Nocardia asteroides TaxID=1824 RepID=UPI0037C61342